jgi:hypothetical protein
LGALHLGIFDQPEKKEFFNRLLIKGNVIWFLFIHLLQSHVSLRRVSENSAVRWATTGSNTKFWTQI